MEIDYERQIFEASRDQVWARLPGEASILNLRTGRTYELSGSALYLWELLQTPRNIENICEEIVKVFDVSPNQAKVDIVSFLAELKNTGLIASKYRS